MLMFTYKHEIAVSTISCAVAGLIVEGHCPYKTKKSSSMYGKDFTSLFSFPLSLVSEVSSPISSFPFLPAFSAVCR